MLCPAAATAAAAAVLLLALSGPALSCSLEDELEVDFSLCSHSFYRQTPPPGASAWPPLRPLCHRLPGGQAFATLSRPTCDTAVSSAFHLSYGWEEREGAELTEEEEDDIGVAVPALLRRGESLSNSVSPGDSPLQQWDSAVTTLVRSSISPQCSTLGGDLYILTGSGPLGAAEDDDEKCQMRPQWAAVCCTIPEKKGGFSVGVIGEAEEGVRQVSVKELEEILGVSQLFSGGCGGADGEAAAVIPNFSGIDSENVQNKEADGSEEQPDTDLDSGTNDQDENDNVQESTEASTTKEQVADVDAQSEESDGTGTETYESNTADDQSEESDDAVSSAQQSYAAYSEKSDDVGDTQKTSSDASTSESGAETQSEQTRSQAGRSMSPESSRDSETLEEEGTKTNKSSTLVSIISTTASILKAPLRPLFNRITQFPGQVIYVLQEDLGVLSALPGGTYNLFHLLTSDFLSGVRSAAETVFGVGNKCCSCAYHCSSSMFGALMDHCYAGLMGMVTLGGDTVGIFGGAVDNTWWVTKLFGGRLWKQSKGYVGTVVSEVGGQAQAVGGGLGRLTWTSGSTVGKVLKLIWDFIYGVLDIVFGAIRIAFGKNEG